MRDIFPNLKNYAVLKLKLAQKPKSNNKIHVVLFIKKESGRIHKPVKHLFLRSY